MRYLTAILAVVAFCGSSAFAGSPDVSAELEAMKAQLQQQQQLIEAQASEITKLKQTTGETWLNEAQAQQVKSLIHDVLNDAETRASLSGGNINAGYDDGFFIRASDGSFGLKINAQSQTRFTYASTDGDDSGFFFLGSSIPVDDDNHGFEQRRTKLKFSGHIGDPSLTFGIQLNFTPGYDIGLSISEDLVGPDAGHITIADGGASVLEEAWAQWDLGNGWAIKVGQFKVPLLRDEAVDSSMQLAVERGISTQLMTADRSQGIQVSYVAAESSVPFRVMAMIHDGSRQANTEWGQSMFEIGLAARAEFLLEGTFEQFDDYSTGWGQSRGIMIGAGLNYDVGNSDGNLSIANAAGLIGAFFAGMPGGDVTPDVFTWTVDVSAELPEFHGLTLMAAVIGQHVMDLDDTALVGGPGTPSDLDQYAIQLQAGAFVVPDQIDAFIRYEYLSFSDDATYANLGPLWVVVPTGEDDVHTLTFGGNYYLNGHQSKFSADVVFVLDGIAFGDTGAGVSATTDDQFVIRLQYQFLF